MTLTIQPAQEGDVATLASVITRAFLDDPITEWMLPDEHRRSKGLLIAIEHTLDQVYLRLAGAWTNADASGVSHWGKPGDPKPSALQQRDVD